MAKARQPKKTNTYKMPDPLPQGLILQDIAKKKWQLGPSIGKGGFGEIYTAKEADSRAKDHPYVVKIEPHENGPLFVEMHFYMRNAKAADVEDFIKEKKLSGLGMPVYFGSGSHEHASTKYRFLVMNRFGSDVWKLFLDNKRIFPTDTVFKLGVQILDVLEYIHSRGYIHADIKGANVLLGIGKEAQSQVYLVDFGLSTRYSKNYKPDPKKAHNGTIEYLSIDAHSGVESRRGDLEILGYNLTQWLGCVLPWEKNLTSPTAVQESKQKHMDKLPSFFQVCFGKKSPPTALVDYFKYVTLLKFETDPDYKKLRKILVSGIESAGGSLKSPFKFKPTATPAKRKTPEKTSTPRKKSKSDEVTPKRNGRKALNASVVVIDESDEEEEVVRAPVKKGRQIRKKKEETAQNGEVNGVRTNGYTAEMQRLQEKVEARKKLKQKGKNNAS